MEWVAARAARRVAAWYVDCSARGGTSEYWRLRCYPCTDVHSPEHFALLVSVQNYPYRGWKDSFWEGDAHQLTPPAA